MRRQSAYEMLTFEAFAQHLIEYHQRLWHSVLHQCLNQTEIIVVVQDVKIRDNALIRNLIATKTNHLVEYRQCITHRSIGFLRYHIQCHIFGINALILRYILQMRHCVVDGDTIEIVDLTTRQNGWYNLMLLGRSKYKYSMRRWLFQCLQKGIERRCRQHVHLIDDIDAIATDLRRNAHLVNQITDIVNRVVRCGI